VAKNILTGRGKPNDTGQNLSSHNEASTMRTPKPNQKIAPTGVMIIFSLFLLIATWYRNSTYRSLKPIILDSLS
jgi:hypothetical protein